MKKSHNPRSPQNPGSPVRETSPGGEEPSHSSLKGSAPQAGSKALRPVKRFGIGARAVTQMLLAFLILLFAFYLGMSYYGRQDFTVGAEFTLSDTTEKLLRSPALQERDAPVTIIAALRQNSPHYARLKTLLSEYERLSRGKIQIDSLDPIRDQDRALEVSNNYGSLLSDQLFTDDLFIVDARLGEKLEPTAIRFIPVEELLVKRTDENKQRRVVGYRDEAFLSSALLSAIEGTPRRMYLISDKSDLEVGDMDSPWRVLTEALLKQNILLVPTRISEIETIPADAEGVVLVSPKYDLEEQEMGIFTEYWQRPSSSLMVIMEPTGRPENLRAFLRKHGVSLRNDRLITVRNGRTEAQVQALFAPGSPINEGLADKATTFEGKIASLEVREGAEDLVTNGIQAIPLLVATEGYWGETDYTKPDPSFDEASDIQAPLYLAASVLKGNASADQTADDVSKMVVTSTADFLHPDRLREEQLDFVKNATNWLLGREELMGIGPRALERRKLNLIGSEVSSIERIVLFFIPAGLLSLALLTWSIRRA